MPRSARALGAILLAPAIIAQAQAQAQSARLPPAVQAAQAEDLQSCRAMGGRLTVQPGYVTHTDFNGDGKPDYLLNQHRLQCSKAASLYCGSAGCGHLVFISQGNAYRPVVSITGDEAQIRTIAGKSVLHFPNEGDPRGATTWAWNGKDFALATPASAPRPASGASRTGADAGTSAAGGWEPVVFAAVPKAEVARRYPFVRAANKDYNLDFESGQKDGWVNYPATSHVGTFQARGQTFLVVSPQETGCAFDCYAQVFADSGQGFKLIRRFSGLLPMFWWAGAGDFKFGLCNRQQPGVRARDSHAIWKVGGSGQVSATNLVFEGYASLGPAPVRCTRY